MADGGKTPTTAREIIHSLRDRFRPDVAGDLESTLHYDIGGPNGGQFTVTVAGGTCTVQDGWHGTPACVLKAMDQVYEDVALGRRKIEWAFITGKIKASNLNELRRFQKLFTPLARDPG